MPFLNLARNRHRFDYISVFDLDEIIVPAAAPDVPAMIRDIQREEDSAGRDPLDWMTFPSKYMVRGDSGEPETWVKSKK